MDEQKIHESALLYARTKLNEFQIENREAIACGNIDMTNDEIQYLKSAYEFALERLG